LGEKNIADYLGLPYSTVSGCRRDKGQETSASPRLAPVTRGGEMIARVWRGWTKSEDADAYEKLLREVIYPGLQKIKGYCGGYIFRQNTAGETEFVTVNLFESLEAVKAFAGPHYEAPVFEPETRRLLSKVEPTARHYEVKHAPPVKMGPAGF
jgi:heme-degrading monooxygenase HmoA